ncbi:MAG: winged helix-turn-helix transcriptional regulator [Novosphingobium sp.]
MGEARNSITGRPAIAALTAQMQAHGTDRDAPVREVMGLLGDRWTTLILLVLATGACRHAELRRVLGGLSEEKAISQRMLTLKLRALERDGFVLRHATTHVPPQVSYELSQLGTALHGQAGALIGWIEVNSPAIANARSAFAASAQGLPLPR